MLKVISPWFKTFEYIYAGNPTGSLVFFWRFVQITGPGWTNNSGSLTHRKKWHPQKTGGIITNPYPTSAGFQDTLSSFSRKFGLNPEPGNQKTRWGYPAVLASTWDSHEKTHVETQKNVEDNSWLSSFLALNAFTCLMYLCKRPPWPLAKLAAQSTWHAWCPGWKKTPRPERPGERSTLWYTKSYWKWHIYSWFTY